MTKHANPQPPRPAANFRIAAETRIGARRINQDRLGHWHTERCLLMVVTDGLGGHPLGEVAAEIAIAHFRAAFLQQARPHLPEPKAFLTRSMLGAHLAIVREAERQALPDTPRTVAVACVVQDRVAYWAHIGDCRFYLVRQNRVAQRSLDHTLVQQLLERGRLGEESLRQHPERHRLLRCLGSDDMPEPAQAQDVSLVPGDIILLCSDGLWSQVTTDQLVDKMSAGPIETALPELALLAERQGGAQCDNVTALAMVWNR